MSLLKQKIIERIHSEGPINFETFMDMALYYPGLGYYARDTAKIGRTGDFYTSPHLHRIFGAMLGRQMEEMWDLMDRPALFRIIEMGAGMGYLAKDMLEYLRARDVLFSHLTYTIIERNPSIEERQRKLLEEFSGKVDWYPDLGELGPAKGCFLSNELLDAFPVRIVEMDAELMEVFVSVHGEYFIEIKRHCTNELKEYVEELNIDLPRKYRTEMNLNIRDWLRKVSDRLAEGFILTVDYGYPAWDYYSEERSRGTLLCYYQHQINEDPYRNVGEQDITAHVNFSSLKKWGEELGLRTVGFCPQGTYLVSLGIDEVITELYGERPDAFDIAKIKGLILPPGMGESHKVMIQHKGEGSPELRGFSIKNQAGKL